MTYVILCAPAEMATELIVVVAYEFQLPVAARLMEPVKSAGGSGAVLVGGSGADADVERSACSKVRGIDEVVSWDYIDANGVTRTGIRTGADWHGCVSIRSAGRTDGIGDTVGVTSAPRVKIHCIDFCSWLAKGRAQIRRACRTDRCSEQTRKNPQVSEYPCKLCSHDVFLLLCTRHRLCLDFSGATPVAL